MSERLELKTFPVSQKGFTLYLAVIPASKLLRLCTGLRASTAQEAANESRSFDSTEDAEKLVEALNQPTFAKEVISAQEDAYDDDQPYQRIYDEARVRSIASYLKEEDAMLPNAVILATRDDVEVGIKKVGDVVALTMEWETGSVPLNIIDGQHRVEGLRILAQDSPDEFAEFGVPITLLIDLPFWVQAQLFAVVNGRQKQVFFTRSRVYDLLGYLPMKDKEVRHRAYQGEMALHRFCHHVVKVLNQSEKSPWKGRIKMRGSGVGIVTQAALVDHLAIYLKPKKERPDTRILPVLFPFYHDSDITGLAKSLIIYFVGLQRAHQKYWASDEALKGSLFGKTNGVAVMLSVLHNLALLAGGASNLQLQAVTDYWSKVDERVVNTPPKGGSKGYQAEVTATVMQQMLGKDYDKQLAEAAERMKPVLREGGGLI